ncbi:hypothetical protein [Paraburkholderia dinghuensis]|uniref:Uncharacterized protein n=1 Tax=Paraburkholderia dinghuensis TaxID=2305225 RepID=A0A3N6N0X3_9BURK|nr:hypothetical protein [Paraburkholderia dinghuensis]RQH01137.1 hypothetical protein D1Y85_23860 [Paraburkholderia dinghuensis]
MAKRRRFARASPDATRAYTLQPVRSKVARLSMALAWTIAASASGAAVAVWALAPKAQAHCPESSPDALHAELADAQLKLEQERAARAALQKSADSAQAAVARLEADLVFLRSQRGGTR